MPLSDSLRASLFALLVSIVGSGSALGAEVVQVRSTFGVAAGTATRYAVTLRYGNPESPLEDRFDASVLRPGGDGAERVALLLVGDSDSSAKEPQLAVLGLRKDGVLLGDQRSVLGPERAELVAALFASVQGPTLRPGARWSDEESLALAYLPLDLPMDHEVVKLDDGRLSLRSRVTEEKTVATLGYIFRLKSWSRKIVFAQDSMRPTALEVELRSENEDPGEDPSPYLRHLRVELSEERALGKEESGALHDEITRLETVEKALNPGTSGGGLFGGLFGGGGSTAPAGDPLALLTAYENSHPKGLLAQAAPVLRRRILERNERQARAKALQAKTDALLGAPAPDFTLEDLKGDKVSLSDLRGKAVLLVFWGYG